MEPYLWSGAVIKVRLSERLPPSSGTTRPRRTQDPRVHALSLLVLRTENVTRVREGYIRSSTRGHARTRLAPLGSETLSASADSVDYQIKPRLTIETPPTASRGVPKADCAHGQRVTRVHLTSMRQIWYLRARVKLRRAPLRARRKRAEIDRVRLRVRIRGSGRRVGHGE
jgi:hypothetical protein